MMPSVADVKSLLETIGNLYQRGSQLEAQRKIVELQEMILELREAALSLREENVAIKEQLEEQNEFLDTKKRLEWDGAKYWLSFEDEKGEKEGPFCQRCWDDEQKLIRLQRFDDNHSSLWFCLKCRQNYNVIHKRK